MAPNNMWLVNTESGERYLLAKYYPSGGWEYRPGDMTAFIERHNARHLMARPDMDGALMVDTGPFGGNPWRLEYTET